MSGFFRSTGYSSNSEIFTDSKQDKVEEKKPSSKLEQQSMYDFTTPSEKVATAPTALFKSAEAEQAQPTSQPSKSSTIKEKPSMFSKMKVKTKDDKKPEYEPVLIPEPSPAERSEREETDKQPPEEPEHQSSAIPKNVTEEPQVPKAYGKMAAESPPTKEYQSLPQPRPMTDDEVEKKMYGATNDTIEQRKLSEKQKFAAALQAKEQLTKKKSEVSPTSLPVKESKATLTPPQLPAKKESPQKKAPKTEEQPKKVTQRDEVAEIQHQILSSKQHLFDEIKKQKQIKSSIIEEAEELERLKEEHLKCAKQQNDAIEKQEYLLADTLEGKLATISEKMSATEQSLQELQLLYEASEREMVGFYVKEHQRRRQHVFRLKSAREEAAAQLGTLQKSEHERQENQKARIERERKKLKLLQHQIKFNKEKVDECQHQYNEDLNNQTQKLQQDREELDSKRKIVAIEIEQMERKLMLKRKELADINEGVLQAEKSIEGIKKGFESEYRKIVTRKQKLAEMERQRDEQNRSVVTLELTTEDQSRQFAAHMQVMAGNIRYIDEQTQSFESDSAGFEHRLQQRSQRFTEFLDRAAKLKEYEQQNKSRKEKIKDIEFRKSSLSIELGSLEAKKKQLKQKIPTLEAEKASMIAVKNFKGAASKAAELKEANERLLEVNSKAEASFIEQKMLQEELSQALQGASSKDEEESLRSNLALSQYRFELLKLEDLQNEKITIMRCKLPEAASKQKFIDAEIESLRQEIQYLKSSYALENVDRSLSSKPAQEEQIKKPEQEQVSDQPEQPEQKPKDQQPHSPQQVQPEAEAEQQKEQQVDPELAEQAVEYKQFAQQQQPASPYVPLSQ